MYEKGSSYMTINSARSALSTVFSDSERLSIGEHKLIVRFMKGVSRLRPPAPRYSVTWDASKVLNYLHSLSSTLSFKETTLKLVSLLALVTGQRVQTLTAIKLSDIVWENPVQIKISNRLKTTSVNRSNPILVLPPFQDEYLCPVKALKDYIAATKDKRGNCDKLFISFVAPYSAVTSQTISRWLVTVLSLSGIDSSIYTAHSFRHASTSKAELRGVHVDTILKRVGWANNSKVFARFYKRPIENKAEFAQAVLS